MLEMLDLTREENDCYEQLVAHPRATRDQLRRRVTLGDAALREAIDGLAAKGLVSTTHDDPPRLVPAPPEVAVEVLILRQRERFERARIYAAELMDRYRGGDGPSEVGEYIELIRGREAVLQRSEQIQRLTRERFQLLVRCDARARAIDPTVEPKHLADHVEVRRICERRVLEDAEEPQAWPDLAARNEDVRVVPELPIAFALADRALGLLPCDGEDEPAAFIVHPCRLLEVMLQLADTLWELAAPLAPSGTLEAIDVANAGLAGRDREILQLLQAGLTDFAIARRLDVSERTVGRRVSRLMRSAGAQTRFQLGWRAAERGWLAADEVGPADRPGTTDGDDLPTTVTTLPDARPKPEPGAASAG